MNISSIVSGGVTKKKVPRPLNCYMAYRLEKQREIIKQCPEANHRDISKITAKWWKELPNSEKDVYRRQAEKAKIEHLKMYPKYKFSPKKKLTKTRAYKQRTAEEFTSQDIEHQRQVLALLHQAPSGTDNCNLDSEKEAKVDHGCSKDKKCTEESDVCCATCFSSSSKTCFTKTYSPTSKTVPSTSYCVPSHTAYPSPSSPYTLSYPPTLIVDEAANVNYNYLYHPHHQQYGYIQNDQSCHPYDTIYKSTPSPRQYYCHLTPPLHETENPAYNNDIIRTLDHSDYRHSSSSPSFTPPIYYQ